MLKVSLAKDKDSLVRECWSSEPELYEKWHYMAGSGLDACVDATCKDLEKTYNFSLYQMVHENKIVGMFGIEDATYLTGFFIKPEFRTKDYIASFMKNINSRLKRDWFVVLYTKNTRAIDFFIKNGAQKILELPHNGQSVVIYQMYSGEL